MGYEVRSDLSSNATKVPDKIHSESASRTLDYACLFSPNVAPLFLLMKAQSNDD